jgi:hypothetical protein
VGGVGECEGGEGVTVQTSMAKSTVEKIKHMAQLK